MVIVSFFAVILVIIVSLAVVLTLHQVVKKKNISHKKDEYLQQNNIQPSTRLEDQPSEGNSSDIPEIPEAKFNDNEDMKSVLVLFPPECPEERWILENITKNLNEYRNIDCKFFDDSQCRDSLSRWVEDCIKSCKKVLLVCNRAFAAEWNSTTSEGYWRPIVYITKQIIESYTQNNKTHLEKFAVLYLKKEDRESIDCLYFKRLRSFDLTDGNEKEIEKIVRFICDIPIYVIHS